MSSSQTGSHQPLAPAQAAGKAPALPDLGPYEPVPRATRHSTVPSLALLYLTTLIGVVTIVFVLPRAMPGDPLLALEDPGSAAYLPDPSIRTRVLRYYGLDRPLLQQYAAYLGNLAQGDLGWSIARNAPVGELIAQRLPWTLLLMGSSLALASMVSFFAGVTAAWHRGKRRDRALVTALTAVNSIPEYALAAVFLMAFGVLIPLFPLYGARTAFARYDSFLGQIGDVATHLVLPMTALTLSLLGSKFLLVRNTVIASLGEDYMLLARAKGLPETTLKYRHAGRNALLPFVTVLGMQAGFAVGGTVFVESVFAYPGMGTLILQSVEARDYPVLEAAFLVLALTVLAVNLLVDVSYRRLDPRVAVE